MSIYDKNISVIKEKDKLLYDALVGDNIPNEETTYGVDISKNGLPIISANVDGDNYYLNSRYDPEREAERFVKQYSEVPDYAYMIFFGLGNGYIARELIHEKCEHITYLFYEPSAKLFQLVIHNFDISDILECERVRVIIKGMNDTDMDVAIGSGIGLENYKICIYDALPVYKKIYSKDEKNIEQKYRYQITMLTSDLETEKQFGLDRTRNNIYNLRKLYYCNTGEDFKGILPVDRPVIIVAAGPSLEKNAHYLKQAKGRLLIIAVDSALRYLISEGIIPDLAVLVDPRKPVELFGNEEIANIPLAIATDANYKIVEKMNNKIIFISSEGDYYRRVFSLSNDSVGALPNGGSVATMAFSMAVDWGYRTIVLVGQDLALSKDKVHAGKDDFDTMKLKEDKIAIEGYYGGTVYTSRDYNFYREWYGMVISKEKSLKVINATEGGAKIDGTIRMSLKEVIDEYEVEQLDYEKMIREMLPVFSKNQISTLISMWEDSIEELLSLKQKLYIGMRESKKGSDLIRSKRGKKSEITRIQRRIKGIVDECDKRDEIYFVDCMIASEQADVLSDIFIGESDDEKEIGRVFGKLYEYIKALHSAIDDVVDMFYQVLYYYRNMIDY